MMLMGMCKCMLWGLLVCVVVVFVMVVFVFVQVDVLVVFFKCSVVFYLFVVVLGVINVLVDELVVQWLFDVIVCECNFVFVVYVGDFKGLKEVCCDVLYLQCGVILDLVCVLFVFIFGYDDWIVCNMVVGGGYDLVEWFDFLWQMLFVDLVLFDFGVLQIMCESEVVWFWLYCENVCWMCDDIVYVVFNVLVLNNYYLMVGGCNGEFEDCIIVNGFWIDYVVEYVKWCEVCVMVVIFEGDLQFECYECVECFVWLCFNWLCVCDGFCELK